MWETADRASTPKAIYAAKRVFATVDLVGLTHGEVTGKIGDPRASSDSRYNIESGIICVAENPRK
jgi:hypothetical protein